MITIKSLAAGLGALALTAAAATAADADTFSATYGVTVQSSDPGLVLHWSPINAINFDLNQGQSTSFDLFNLWTDEGSLERDDLAGKPISVTFAFTQPGAAGGAIDGVTDGAFALFGIIQEGVVHWSNGGNLLLDFGGGLQLLTHLDNATFNPGLFSLDPGPQDGAAIHATFTAVPEPATWAMMILGMAMVGAGLRLQRRKPQAANAAA